jgi:hypothetical protein
MYDKTSFFLLFLVKDTFLIFALVEQAACIAKRCKDTFKRIGRAA